MSKRWHGLVAALLFALFYLAITGAGYIVELLFGALGLVPGNRRLQFLQEGVSWDHTTVLNIVALALSAVLIWRFLLTGGPDMLRMMAAESVPENGG